MILDGREAWVSGLNVGEEYKGLDPKIGSWRDTHLRVTGPVVQCTQVSFGEDWYWASGEMLSGLNSTGIPNPLRRASRAPCCAFPRDPPIPWRPAPSSS